MPILISRFALAAAIVTLPLSARADDPGSELDALLRTPISTAAKYEQTISDVAASVTVVTSEEIARYGWYTLADALESMGGIHTSYNRGYTSIGVRGLSLPADYNNRFLVLIDGHPLVENVSNSIGVDTTLALDLSQFSRIEVVRGPGSVLYGTGAMFGVINLITRDERDPSAIAAGAGSDGLRTGAARVRFGSGAIRGSVTGSWQEKNGGDLYFREFDHPDTNQGIVRDRDFDDYASVVATFAWRDFRFLALRSSRTKGIPTASWGTKFGADERITDGRTTFATTYKRRLDAARTLIVDAAYDRFRYHGSYPDGPAAYVDQSVSDRLSVEGRHIWDLRPDHRLTTGVELVHNPTATYQSGYGSLSDTFGEPYSTYAVYAQLESQLTPRLSLTAGASYDRNRSLDGQFTPRLAAIYTPRPSTTIKALYGHAFRTPNIYETDYESTGGFLRSENLENERLRTIELVWEQRLGADVFATISLFDVRLDNLIRLQPVGVDEIQHQNVGKATSRGVELRLDHRDDRGIWSYVSYTDVHAREDGADMTNAPRRMLKGGVSTPTTRPLFGGLELQYETSRLTLAGNETGDVLLANLNTGYSFTRQVGITATVRNLFDTSYATPGGPEHVQDVLEQDGRTVLVRLRMTGR
jgi:iron complex outermembrane receptor protein